MYNFSQINLTWLIVINIAFILQGTMDAMDNALRLEKKGLGLIEQPIGIKVESLAGKLRRLLNEER